jgi:alternate signal-mediated exported protein
MTVSTQAPHACRRHARRRSARRRVTFVLGVAVTGVLVGAGLAYAAWTADSTYSGGTVTAGDLSLTTSTPTWKQVTPGVDDPASGTLGTTPTGFFSMPGDIIEIAVPVTAYLQGDNINGGFSVTCAEATGDIDTSFYVQDSTGHRVTTDAALGDTVVVPGLSGSDQGSTTQWSVVITVQVLGDYRWTTPQATDPPEGWSAGAVSVTLEQVRSGAGYVGGSG